MDIEKLKALKTAVEIGSITQAAEHMGYSQPGLTGMLKRLEQEIGYPLLRRGTKGVRLTEAGEAVMPYIDRVLESIRALERALADHAPARERILRIGSYTSITRGILPRSMKRFRQLYPDVQFTIRDGSCMDIEQWLVDGKIDIGLLSCCFTAPLDFVPLLNDPLYAVLPPEEDVGETVPVSYFEGRDFLIPSTGADLESLRVLERGGVHPRFSCLAMEDSAVIKMVEQGMGCSILSELVLRGATDHVTLARSARLSRDRRGRRARQKAQPRHPRVSDMPAGGCAAKRTKFCLTYTPYLSFIINLPFLLGKICFIMQA